MVSSLSSLRIETDILDDVDLVSFDWFEGNIIVHFALLALRRRRCWQGRFFREFSIFSLIFFLLPGMSWNDGYVCFPRGATVGEGVRKYGTLSVRTLRVIIY